MGQSDQQINDETADMLAAVGITVTEQGKAHARKKLADAARRLTPELREVLRQVGAAAA